LLVPPQFVHTVAIFPFTLALRAGGIRMLSLGKAVFAFVAICGAFVAGPAIGQDRSIVVASTTSTQDSGLFDYLLPLFTQKTGIGVKVLALGTGEALDAGRRGEADVLFVHAKWEERRFVAEGEGVKRVPVMYNDFVLLGPKNDPAGVRALKDIAKAFAAIRDKSATFISRGDRSGTHLAELMIWNKDAGIDIEKEQGHWYIASSQGMNDALKMAVASNGYVLSDRATWTHLPNKGDLEVLVQGDDRMFNQYGAILVNPDKHPNVKKDLGQQFIDWLVSPEIQQAIAHYKINGEQLFFPNATDPNG
jgi:tungstate transport system substrate-binding protein